MKELIRNFIAGFIALAALPTFAILMWLAWPYSGWIVGTGIAIGICICLGDGLRHPIPRYPVKRSGKA